MEDLSRLIRIENDYDCHVLAWLRRQVGDDAVHTALRQLGGRRRPYVSAVCRVLDIRPPARRAFRAEEARISRAVGDRYLARIREILSIGANDDDEDEDRRDAGQPGTAPRQRALPFGMGPRAMGMG